MSTELFGDVLSYSIDGIRIHDRDNGVFDVFVSAKLKDRSFDLIFQQDRESDASLSEASGDDSDAFLNALYAELEARHPDADTTYVQSWVRQHVEAIGTAAYNAYLEEKGEQ